MALGPIAHVCRELLLREAPRVLLRNPMRSALAALGIAIGTGAVVCVVAIGEAGSRVAEARLENLGDNLVWVEAGARNVNGVRTGSLGTTSLTIEDMDAIRAQVPEIVRASPNVDGHVQVVHGNRNWNTHYRGVGVDFFEVRNWPVEEGAGLTTDEVEHAADVCLLGRTVRDALFGEGVDPVGENMLIGTRVCQVIGVLSAKGQTATGWDQDDTVVLPYTTVQKKLLGKGYTYLDDVLCSAVSAESVDVAADEVTRLLRERHRIQPGEPDDFNIRRMDEVIKADIAAKRTMAMFLETVAAISLLVGGIGVMNVMLATVTERTREIGVRLAVGAKEWAVHVQFLAEAVMLSLSGGIAGALLGVGASVALGESLGWPVTVPALAVMLAPAFSIAVGVVFGFWPARRAAKLDPIVALGYG